MRNSKARGVRNIAKRIAKTMETTYSVGKPPIYNLGTQVYIKNSGQVIQPGRIIEPGIPTVMEASCLKFIVKHMKKGM